MIRKYRFESAEDSVLARDVFFKSPSTAANFVTGCSTNGLTAWKTVEGEPIRDLLAMPS